MELNATSPFWEKAFFQTKLGHPEELPCPFGRYENFEKRVVEFGYPRYKNYIEAKLDRSPKKRGWFKLRMTSKVEPKYIKIKVIKI
jgi:hypothetical protein